MDTNIPDDKTVKLIEKLKKDFNIYILSNNHNKKRLNEVSGILDIPYVALALKPSKIGFARVHKKVNAKK